MSRDFDAVQLHLWVWNGSFWHTLLCSAAEESLLLTADRVDTPRTPEEHLLTGDTLIPNILTPLLVLEFARRAFNSR